MKAVSAQNAGGNRSESPEVDSRIVYPSYKSFDEMIEIGALRALDDYLTERIGRHIEDEKDAYFLNQHRLDDSMPYRPGVREIWLSRTKSEIPYNYQDLNRPELWRPTEAAEEFALLMDFIRTLPFRATGRMLIIYDNAGQAVPAHRDHVETDICHEFIWFRTNLKKPFYMLNHLTGEKKYVEGYSAWFDSVNQFHGCDGYDGLSFSIRVDGKFTEEFKNQIPVPELNQASRPAFWDCVKNLKKK